MRPLRLDRVSPPQEKRSTLSGGARLRRAVRLRLLSRFVGDDRAKSLSNVLLMLRFTKMNGAGNDFVMIDNRSGDVRLEREQIAHICDRHLGVGADGILLLEKSQNGADFRMRYYNADGGEAEMCGNGARCFARYADRVAGPMEALSFETPAGVIGAELQGELVRLAMSEPKDLKLGITVPLADRQVAAHFVNSGVPHVVVAVDDLESVDVRGLGSAIRQHELFAPKGTNANFMNE